MLRKRIITFLLLLACAVSHAQKPASMVNVFLGSSGDHGQLSPGASAPFHQMNIVPQTDPSLHTGYEYLAKKIFGFTHNRLEGVGCRGAGGLILVKPFLGKSDNAKPLTKLSDQAGPGYYSIRLQEAIDADVVVDGNMGLHHYHFPRGEKGLSINLQHAFNAAFVSNQYNIKEGIVTGTIRARTTCSVGIYTIYYAIAVDGYKNWEAKGDSLTLHLNSEHQEATLRIAFSAVDRLSAKKTLQQNLHQTVASLKQRTTNKWNQFLSTIKVSGDPERMRLFYSLFYRTMQSPYLISEGNSSKGTDGKIHSVKGARYHGWAVWDNFKTQLPLIELAHPEMYQDITSSIAELYQYGKYDFAGPTEPANSVRTEHSAVVLLDAQNKGYTVPVPKILDSLRKDTLRFDYSKPDKYLEACYDMWAMAGLDPEKSASYLKQAQTYTTVWNKEFKDLTKQDVDRMSARNMYQGTIRQYRWNVPFDVKGLVALAEGKEAFTNQLDDFFDNNYFNRANEPDIQSPTLYYASNKPWKYQQLVHQLAVDTVIQYYFNDNSRGIDPFIDRIYKNEPKAFVRTMDDDAGAMSGWFVLTAIGLHQPLIGEPVYYLNVPLFEKVVLQHGNKPFAIQVKNFAHNHPYIKSVSLNGKDLGRLWLTHKEIRSGGNLIIEAAAQPQLYGKDSVWVSGVK